MEDYPKTYVAVEELRPLDQTPDGTVSHVTVYATTKARTLHTVHFFDGSARHAVRQGTAIPVQNRVQASALRKNDVLNDRRQVADTTVRPFADPCTGPLYNPSKHRVQEVMVILFTDGSQTMTRPDEDFTVVARTCPWCRSVVYLPPYHPSEVDLCENCRVTPSGTGKK